MNGSLSFLRPATLRISTDKEVFPPLLEKLRQLLEDKVHVLQNSATEDRQGVLLEEVSDRGGVWSYTVQCQELTFHLQQLHSQTEQELTNIHTQLCEIAVRQQQLSSELSDLQEKKRHAEQDLKGNHSLHTCTLLLHTRGELQARVTEHLAQSERLVFQEQALSALHDLLTQDLLQYQQETRKLHSFTLRILRDYCRSDKEQISTAYQSDHSMQGRNDNQPENSMQSGSVSDRVEVSSSSSSSSFSALAPYQSTATANGVDSDQPRRTKRGKSPTAEGALPTASLTRRSKLTRSGSVKDLIHRFSGTDYVPTSVSPQGSSPSSSVGPNGISPFPETGRVIATSSPDVSTVQMETRKQGEPSKTRSRSATGSPVPSISATPVENGQNNTTESPVRDSSEGSALVKKHPGENKSAQVQFGSEPSRTQQDGSPKTLNDNNNRDSGRESLADSGMGSETDLDQIKPHLPDSPASEEDAPPTPRVLLPGNSNPKYQLFLNNDHHHHQGHGGPGGAVISNGVGPCRDTAPGGPENNGPPTTRLPPRWESSSRLAPNQYRGSLESLTSRDWDNTSDRQGGVDSPPRVFISPYTTTTSMYDYNPTYRMSEFKVPGGISPATSELNLFSYSSRSASPVPTPTVSVPRPRFSTYDTLARRRAEGTNTVIPNHAVNLRSATLGPHNKRDYIEELTKQLDTCQKRNQFLEAESVEMDKERNQIRLEMRGLLVNNEDLLRNNAQLTNEMKRMRDRVMEMERENQAMTENYREMEIELKEARDMMVEANTQEYAFNALQQTLKNRIQDAEDNLETQTQHAQSLAEKLWLSERRLEEFELGKETRDKKTIELSDTIFRLETELGEALQASTQAGAELSLQQKLRADTQTRVEELEESLMEKDQELLRLQGVVTRLQGEVSEKLSDKERTLEEEIQLRERIQLQWKQADRTVDDLHMELQTVNQAKDDLSKQVKQAQEKMIDLESDLEELHDSEQRWASKHKRSIEQTEQLQLKLIQEKDLNEQLDCEKAILERQIRELRVEVDELQTSRVQEDVISRTESRVKELENVLRTEERNKAALNNTVSKLERKINELSDQLEEEHRISTEQKDLLTQRMRALKRQLNEAEEETSRKEAQYRHTQRELSEERETSGRLQRQLLDQHLQMKRKESALMRQTLDSLRLDLSVDEEDGDALQQNISKV